jgi:FkbM family methyltransferase
MTDARLKTPPSEQQVARLDIGATIARLRTDGPRAFAELETVRAASGLVFCLNMQDDPIQNRLRAGDFYERAELDRLKAIVKAVPEVLDVGANIGNHALYFATEMEAKSIVVIEPNPLALLPLIANITANKLENSIDMQHLGVGLSDVTESGYWMKRHIRNLGACKLQSGGGDISVARGDDLFSDAHFDLIKIDVEGMEINVLSGLHETITRCRPVIMVEVGRGNQGSFETWVELNDYEILETLSQNQARYSNYIIAPNGAEIH